MADRRRFYVVLEFEAEDGQQYETMRAMAHLANMAKYDDQLGHVLLTGDNGVSVAAGPFDSLDEVGESLFNIDADVEPPDPESLIEPPPTRQQIRDACGACGLRHTEGCPDSCEFNI